MKLEIDRDLIDLFDDYKRELENDREWVHTNSSVAASNLVIAHFYKVSLFLC